MCILFVEDEDLIRDVARELLEEAGHEVVTASDGCQACGYVDQHPDRFVCLVTDYSMPGLFHGGHVIEHTRAAYPEIPVVLASGFPHATTHEWRNAHRVHLLLKPYSVLAMVELVGRLLA